MREQNKNEEKKLSTISGFLFRCKSTDYFGYTRIHFLTYDMQVKMKLILPQFVFHAFHIEGISQGNLY